jgi:hypothetical protein
VYSAANGVSKIRELFGNQGVVSVYSSLTLALSLNKRSTVPPSSSGYLASSSPAVPSLPYVSDMT